MSILPPITDQTAAPPTRAAFAYLISGLNMTSDLELPSAIAASAGGGKPDVSIAMGYVPHTLPDALRTGPDWEATDTAFLLRLAGIARFLILGGRSIVYQAEPDYKANDLPLYLLGSCLAVLLQQRGSLVFHASAVAVRGRAMLFCGPSGAGKSTMAALLCERGYPLLNDDTCNLASSPQGYSVHADGRMLKLWQNSISHLTLEARRGPAVRTETDKFYLAPPVSLSSALPLGAIFFLEHGADDEPPALVRLTSLQAMASLVENTYKPSLIFAMNLEATYFAASARLQQQAALYCLRRPLNFASVEQTVRLLEENWNDSTVA